MKRVFWVLPLMAIAVGALSSFLFYRSSIELLGALGRVDSPALNQVQALVFDLNSVADGFKSAVAAADKAGLEATVQRAESFRSHVKAYGQVPGQAEVAAAVLVDFDRYFKAATQVAAIVLDSQAGDAAQAAAAMQAAYASTDQRLQKNKVSTQQALDQHIEEAQSLAQRGFLANLLASLLTLALSLGASWLSVRGLIRQLGGRPEDATRVVHRIASGDLSQPVQLKDQGRSSLLYAMRGMQEQLARMIGDVRSAVVQVDHAVQGISHGNQALADRSVRQASSLETSAARIEGLTASVRQNAEDAQQAHALAARATSAADQGTRAMREAISTMDGVSERARKIVDITALIDGIAFQTNILALNAAVEAARAGEQGRGFSVVAGEVRTLARRAGAAAKDIKALIDDSAQHIDSGARHVNSAGAAMQHLVDSVQQVGEIIARISVASAEQRAGIEQVNGAVAELGHSTQQNHALVEQAGQAAQELQTVARQLAQAIGHFQVGDGAAAASRPAHADAPMQAPSRAGALAQAKAV